MDKKDKINKNKRKKKSSKRFVTHAQLDMALDRAIEDKFFESAQEEIIITSVTGPNTKFFKLTEIPQGQGASDRVGLKVRPKSLTIRLLYSGRSQDIDPFNTVTHSLIRVIVFQWKQDAMSQEPQAIDILEPLNGINIEALAFYNLENIDKFRVIFTKIIHLNDNSGSGQYVDQDTLYKSFSTSNQHLLFRDGADATTGQIYIMLVSNKGNTNSGPRVSFVSRFRYEDA